jgi:uncharacterized protein YegP (UPF0339 family)
VSNLDAATTYYFRLNAQNQFGTVNGSILNFQTLANPTVEAPVVKTKAAASIGNTGATLRGNVVPGGAETSYWFEYSSDVLLGSVLIDSTDSTSAGSGTNGLDVETSISGLIRNTTYYFRLVARNSQGTVLGDKLSFKTKSDRAGAFAV